MTLIDLQQLYLRHSLLIEDAQAYFELAPPGYVILTWQGQYFDFVNTLNCAKKYLAKLEPVATDISKQMEFSYGTHSNADLSH